MGFLLDWGEVSKKLMMGGLNFEGLLTYKEVCMMAQDDQKMDADVAAVVAAAVSAVDIDTDANVAEVQQRDQRDQRNPFIDFLQYNARKRLFYGRMRQMVYEWMTAYEALPKEERKENAYAYIEKRTNAYIEGLTTQEREEGLNEFGIQDALNIWHHRIGLPNRCVVRLYSMLVSTAIYEEWEMIKRRFANYVAVREFTNRMATQKSRD
jgi:hypothetical protein